MFFRIYPLYRQHFRSTGSCEKISPEIIQEKQLKAFEEARLNVLNYYNEKIAMGGVLSATEELNKSQEDYRKKYFIK